MAQLTEGEDYYINSDGMFVFTEQYHINRGYCCKNGCLHCPYGYKKQEQEENILANNPAINRDH
ncbi:MAG: hypothetical protein H0W62_00580 [Chitinophagales bacterium]|nr:hypothetical protein [Chitinophagales bacterium]